MVSAHRVLLEYDMFSYTLSLTFVPLHVLDSTENLDEMLLQFRGREEELVMTLRTMRMSTSTSNSDSLTPNQEDDYNDSLVFESDKEGSTVATNDNRRSPFPDDSSGPSYSSDSGNIGE